MNAVARLEFDSRESVAMPENDPGEMRADIRHLQSDVTDIKQAMRAGFDKVDKQFEKVDKQFEKVDARFQKVDDRFESLQREMCGIKDAISSAKVWAIGLYAGLAGALFLVMAHGFRWL